MALTYKDVADIIKIIDASNCDEVIVELPETKIVVRRGAPATTGTSVATPTHHSNQMIPLAGPKLAATANTRPVDLPEADASVVRAPMTGTFYRASSPKDPPFVDIGSTVKKGSTLCTIEVMKLFTTIQAVADGIVTQIYVDNATLVQIDQPMFRIEAP
ncbi:biotin/lipoyl-containing protein [Acidiphilium acidophilum]|uniref:acetyl-CoA carboxylase biotin carboxyl carrier protein n=1 Tax=Acidiphilium acidophilum TaxID=76588 RepID=UPI002E8E632C|nr:biotin/lipoyl-containing protein [Acidiphilium acidophilum]